MNNGPKSPPYKFCVVDSAALLLKGSTGTTLNSVGDRVEDLSSKLLTFLVVFLSVGVSPALPDVPLASIDDCGLLLLGLFASSVVAPVAPFSPA